MRYTYLQTIEKKIQEMTEDRGSRKDKSCRIALLVRQKDLPILKEKHNFNLGDSEDTINVSFRGFERCIVSGEISNTLFFRDSPSKVKVDFSHGADGPMMHIVTSSRGLDATMILYPNKNVYADTVSTTAVMLMASEDDDTLYIEYRHIDHGYEIVKTVVNEGIFELDDVFEINTLDTYDEMYVYSVRTGKMMSNVHVPGNWVKSIFSKEEN